MRYIIIFLVGFFLGGMYGGNLGSLFHSAKELVLKTKESSPKEYKTVEPTPEPKVIEVAEPRKYRAVRKAPVKKAPVKSIPADREKVYTIQVASFKKKAQARQHVERLIKQEYDAYIAPAQSSKPPDWYRVCIGETISLEQAKALNSKLKPVFKDSFIYWF